MTRRNAKSTVAPVEPFGVIYRADIVLASSAPHPKAATVFAYLLTYVSSDRPLPFPHQETIADDLEISVDTVQRALNGLRDVGLISWGPRLVGGRKIGNEYTMHGLVERLRGSRTTAVSAEAADSRRAKAATPQLSTPQDCGVVEQHQEINTSEQHQGAPSPDDAHEIATRFYEFVKAKTNGIAPKFLALRAVVAGALSQGCTADEIRAALSTLWRERQITAPNTAMIVELCVRDRTTRPELPTRDTPDNVRRCYRDDCVAIVLDVGTCLDDHEQPAPDLVVTIEKEHHA
jgi:hypothetical protein